MVLTVLDKNIPNIKVGVFGSRYNGTAKKYSDLDLIIFGKNRLSQKIISEIREDFEDSDIPFRIDIIDWNAISHEFQRVILREGYAVIHPKA